MGGGAGGEVGDLTEGILEGSFEDRKKLGDLWILPLRLRRNMKFPTDLPHSIKDLIN